MSQIHQKLTPRTLLVVGGIFFLLVVSMWIPFGLKSGMGYETGFAFYSETHSLIKGFIFQRDRLRIFTSFFYHLSYLLAEALGIGGSFLTYQIVYALLWWGRGILVFLMLSKLIPKYFLFNYLIGSLVIVHASDHALNWVGQLNQFGMIFWMLLSFYMLANSLDSDRRSREKSYLGLSVFFVFMSLWSYESQLGLVLIVPLLLLCFYGFTRRNLKHMGIYYIIPAVYILLNVLRYLFFRRGGYQQSVLRDDFKIFSLWNDFWYNIDASLRFWDWAGPMPIRYPEQQSLLFPCATAVLFVIGALILKRNHKSGEGTLFPGSRFLSVMLAVGFILLAASFPAYLILNSARWRWRTQFLAGTGTALLMGSIIGLVATLTSRERFKFLALLCFGAIVSFFGSAAALKAGAFHYDIWERHRQVIAQVLHVAPKVKPNTLIVLANLSKDADPFGDNMWFDMSIRLAYPDSKVSGLYFYPDGMPPPGSNLILRAGIWQSSNQGFPSLLPGVSISQTLFIQFDENGCAKVASAVPSFLGEENLRHAYDPTALIEKGPPSARAIRRYSGTYSSLEEKCVMSARAE